MYPLPKMKVEYISMAHDVFLCYSSHDKAVADAMCAALENRKIRCWIAPRDVLPGVPYAEALIDAITQCRLFVLVYSAHANTSPQVIHEVERAVSKGIPVLPFRIEDVPPSKSMEYFISTTHWLDAMTPPLDRHLKRLADTVETLLTAKAEINLPSSGDKAMQDAEGLRKAGPQQNPREPAAAQPAGNRKPPSPVWRNSSRWKIVAAFCLIVVLIGSSLFLPAGLIPAVWKPTDTRPATSMIERTKTEVPTPTVEGLTATGESKTQSGPAALGKPISFTGHTRSVYGVAFSPDGKYVLTGSRDETVKLWDANTGAEVRAFWCHADGVESVAFSPDGKYVLTGGADKMAKLWDAATGAKVRTFGGHWGAVFGVAFSPDGKYVLTGSADHTAKLWNAATGANVRVFRGHTDPVSGVAFSPDGKYVLTGSADGTAKLWDAATGANVRTFSGHTGSVSSVAFSPDGKHALTGSYDKTAMLWDAATGANERVLRGHAGSVSSVAFSPDGKRVLTGSADGTARIWDTD